MAGFGKGGGRGNTGALELDGTSGDAGDSGLGRTSGDTEVQELGGTTSPTQSTKSTSKKSISSSIYFLEASCKPPSASRVWAGLPSKPSISTKTPSGTDDNAGSRTWSEHS